MTVRTLALTLLLALACGDARPALAASSEDAQRAGQIQVQAKEAWDERDGEEALRLATRAISLDPGAGTWLAQQIRVEVLEFRGALEEAMEHVEAYLALDGLFPEHVAWGEEAKARIGERLAVARGKTRLRRGRLGAGVGLAVGGAVPLGLGIGWMANYGAKTGAGLPKEDYLGFLDAGIALTAVGAVMEGVGVALIASGAGDGGVAVVPSLGVGPDGVAVGLSGRW